MLPNDLSNSLAPFGFAFGQIVAARRDLYENGWLKSKNLGVPVVSVGNLTVGGTGKTPLVALVARMLAAQNHKVCILTRGYKRRNPNERVVVSDGAQILTDAQNAGDEPFELAEKLLKTAAVIADKNRFEAGIWARENLNSTAFVLDDGFQHYQLKRDLDIVCIDATNPFGNNRILPAGILREPIAALNRADLIVITRADLVEKSQISNLKSQISNLPILEAQNTITAITEISDFQQSPKSKALAFCALGNPNNFYETLRRANFELMATQNFADHHVYTQANVDSIEKRARENGAEILLTTAKDAVKLREMKFDLPCFVVEIEAKLDDENLLREMLERL